LPAPLHVILATLGTDGDVLPYVGLGAALRRRGHRVTLVAAEDYRGLAGRHGLGFAPLVSGDENRRLLFDPDFWDPVKGPVVGARWGVRLLGRNYELFAGLARDGESVFVASPALLAARLVQEKLGRPLATIILQPWMIRSSTAPPVMPAGLSLPPWAPRPVRDLYWWAFDRAGELLMGRQLWALRRRLGLPPVRRVFDWWLSPQLVIGMFPEAYGRPQADWAPQIRLVGFPRFDGRPGAAVEDDLATFCAQAEPPVTFTFGTGMVHGSGLFRACVEACRILGVRGILLTRYAAQLPTTLPPNVRHAAFAPFRDLFPRCAAVVHHGGVGTIAEALAAGVPQLILPIAFDQKDNAIRVKSLGAGDWLRARRARGDRIAAALSNLITPGARDRCRAVAGRFASGDALDRAARLVEGLVDRSRRRARTSLASGISQ
jgi:UDP:flavonoid glycosyltransferase YjiC (YdhE family)